MSSKGTKGTKKGTRKGSRKSKPKGQHPSYLEEAADKVQKEAVKDLDELDELTSSSRCSCTDNYITLRCALFFWVVLVGALLVLAVYILATLPHDDDDEFTSDVYVLYIIIGASFVLASVCCLLPRPKVPRSYRRVKVAESVREIVLPGKDDEDEAAIFKDLFKAGESHVSSGPRVYRGITCKPPMKASDCLPEEILSQFFSAEAKEEMTEILANELDDIFFPFSLPDDSSVMDLVYESIVEQFEYVMRCEPCPSVFTKSFKAHLTKKVNSLVDIPFISMETQQQLMYTIFGVVDVLLPVELRGTMDRAMVKNLMHGIPPPKKFLRVFKEAKDDVIETLSNCLNSERFPDDLIERLVSKVWGVLEGMISCVSPGAIPPKAKQAIVEKMNRQINIPFLDEDQEAELIFGFFAAMELALPAESLAILAKGKVDRDDLDDVFSDDTRDEIIGMLGSIDIPLMSNERTQAMAETMFDTFEEAVRDSMDAMSMLDTMLTHMVADDLLEYLGDDASGVIEPEIMKRALTHWAHAKTQLIINGIMSNVQSEATRRLERAIGQDDFDMSDDVEVTELSMMNFDMYTDVIVRSSINALLGTIRSSDVTSASLEESST